jgi:hypothetical protein
VSIGSSVRVALKLESSPCSMKTRPRSFSPPSTSLRVELVEARPREPHDRVALLVLGEPARHVALDADEPEAPATVAAELEEAGSESLDGLLGPDLHFADAPRPDERCRAFRALVLFLAAGQIIRARSLVMPSLADGQ